MARSVLQSCVAEPKTQNPKPKLPNPKREPLKTEQNHQVASHARVLFDRVFIEGFVHGVGVRVSCTESSSSSSALLLPSLELSDAKVFEP